MSDFSVFRSLRCRNYRLFFYGQILSLTGTWMQNIAAGWLVYRLTRSEVMLAFAVFAGQIPVFLLSPFAGVIGDRMSRHRIILTVQIVSMLQAFTLGFLTISGRVEVWHIITLAFILGAINAFEITARQAFVIDMVGSREYLGNAIALNSALNNASRLIGPSVAGIIVANGGEGICFIINGASFLSAIAAQGMMKIRHVKRRHCRSGMFTDIKEGFTYMLGFTPIRDIILTAALLSMVAAAFPVLLPVFSRTVLGGGPETYGYLAGATGLGALSGTLFLAVRKSVLGLDRIIGNSLVLFGAGLVMFSVSKVIILSLAVLACVGFCMVCILASCNTIIQTIVEEDKRGRVISLYVTALTGAAPAGSLTAGIISDTAGAPDAILSGGIICIIAGIIFAKRLPLLRKKVSPIFKSLGLPPEPAAQL